MFRSIGDFLFSTDLTATLAWKSEHSKFYTLCNIWPIEGSKGNLSHTAFWFLILYYKSSKFLKSIIILGLGDVIFQISGLLDVRKVIKDIVSSQLDPWRTGGSCHTLLSWCKLYPGNDMFQLSRMSGRSSFEKFAVVKQVVFTFIWIKADFRL